MKKKIIGLIRDASLKKKLIYIYIGGIVLPVIVLSLVYCLLAVNTTKASMKQELEYDIAEIGSNIEECIEKSCGIINSIYYDTALMKTLKMKQGDFYDYLSAAKQIDLISRYNIQYDFIEKITIYSYNNNLYKSGSLELVDNIKNKSDWYDAYISENKDFSIISYRDSNTNKNMLSLVRRLNYIAGGQDILKFDISCSYIAKQLEYNKFNCSLWLVDKNDKSVAVSGISNQQDLPDTTAYCIEKPISFADSYSVFCNYHMKAISQNLLLFFYVVIIILILVLCIFLLLMKPIILRLDTLTKSIEGIQHERFTKISEQGLANDELGKLIRCYNRAIDRIDILINKVYSENLKRIEIENEKSRAKFMLLMGQLNPHFMFNILEIMRMNMVKKGDREASQLIYEMSMILRNIISWGSDLVDLKSEMEVVNAYLNLSKYSFENDIDINIDISEKALKCTIPKMTVQIFAENAIRHGLENVLYKRKMEIKADVIDDSLIICVSDNGVGMSSELVNAINEKKIENDSVNFGIGISNVIERLRIYYGDNASLTVQSSPGERTAFTLNIPISTNKENEVC